MQITGMLLGMTGTIIVSIGDTIIKVFSRCIRELKGKHDESFEDDPDAGEYQKLNS